MDWSQLRLGIRSQRFIRSLRRRSPSLAGAQRFGLAKSLRILSAALLILALSGVQIPTISHGCASIFLVDFSDSIGPSQKTEALDFFNLSVKEMGKNDRVGVVIFGGEAVVEQTVGSRFQLSRVQSAVSSTHTDIASAIDLATELLAGEKGKTIVLLSDGNQTQGDAEAAAAVAASRGVTLHVRPLFGSDAPSPEPRIAPLVSPNKVRLGLAFRIQGRLRGSPGGQYHLSLYDNGREVARELTEVDARGQGQFDFQLSATSRGFHVYTVTAQAPGGGSQDEVGTVVYAEGPPRVLWVTMFPERQFLIEMLRRSGMIIEVVLPRVLPQDAEELIVYDSIVFDDVPAVSLSDSQEAALIRHTERQGGGFIMTGAARSFGPGGYQTKPLEVMLPVEARLRRKEQASDLALVWVIDKSGSMAAREGDRSKISLAKEAISRTAEVLEATDLVGLIAFDSIPESAVPLQMLGSGIHLQEGLSALEASGGTAIYPALVRAADWLSKSPVQRRHIMLLSDGQEGSKPDFKALLKRMKQDRVVVSTVGIGDDIDEELLRELAESTGGRSYLPRQLDDLWEIFLHEAVLASGRWLVDRPFRPLALQEHPLLRGLNMDAFPQLGGYVTTTPRPEGLHLLAAPGGDPILSVRDFGLGRTLVFTSDLYSDWTRELRSWPPAAALWQQIVEWSCRSFEAGRLQPTVRLTAGQARIDVEARNPLGGYANSIKMGGRLENPDGVTQELAFEQSAPGLYEASFQATQRGAYRFTIRASGAAQQQSVHLGFHLSRLPEDREAGVDWTLLRGIADLGGGVVLSAPQHAEPRDGSGGMEIWWPATFLALLCSAFELVVRNRVIRV